LQPFWVSEISQFCDSAFITLFFKPRPTTNNEPESMGLLGDFAKGFLLLTVAIWILAIAGAFITGYTALALHLTVGFIVPLSMIAYEYFQNRKKEKTVPCFSEIRARATNLSRGSLKN
jgi:hypothetical protein